MPAFLFMYYCQQQNFVNKYIDRKYGLNKDLQNNYTTYHFPSLSLA